MNEQLVIRLGTEPTDPIYWIVWSLAEQEIIASGELPDAPALASLSERAGNRPVIALVPTSDVSLRWVTLPAKAGRKALAAIPYMLEEDISGEIEAQFFALGQKQDDQQQVAVVEKARIEQWLQVIRDAGLRCGKLIPDILALPQQDQEWSVLQLGNQFLLRQDEWKGMQGESDWMLPAVSHFVSQQEDALTIANYSDIELPELDNVTVAPQQLEMPMQILAKEALTTPFNLLQGDYKPKKESSGVWKKWRTAAILAGIAVTASLVDKAVTLNQLQAEEEQVWTDIQQNFKTAFPEVRRVTKATIQPLMRQKMKELEDKSGGSASMLLMLSQLSEAFESSNIKPQSMRFNSQRAEMRLQAVASSFEALQKFSQMAEQQGFTVQQGAVNNRDTEVVGSITIRS
ncbi:type II secretion system protein GspL [Alteromonadaceae bacterium M269]|nr:type II secretion system protein GspL [Alteromonadaceae bacterium M269]